MSARGPRELARDVGAAARELAGKARRMVITRATSAIWQVAGHLLLDGDRETRDAEVFGGIGFASRPNATDEAEALVWFVGRGAAANAVIAAMRQEAVRRRLAADLAAGETQIYNSAEDHPVILRLKADGTAELRTPTGVALELALKADLVALRTALSAAVIAVGGAGAADVVVRADTASGGPNAWPIGTKVLKAE